MRKILMIVSIFFLFTGCETKWGKYNGYSLSYDNSVDYYIQIDKGDEILLTDSQPTIKKKGTLVRFVNEFGKSDTLLLGKNDRVIESFVNEANFDGTFIIVDQKPAKEICECDMKCLSTEYKGYDSLPTYEMCKEALRKSTFHQYWIVNVKEDLVYGPFSRDKFLAKKNDFKIIIGLKSVVN